MPSNRKLIQPEELSIHFFVNGFSFCTPSKIEFTPKPEKSEDFKTILNDYLSYYPKDNFQSINVVMFQNPSTFIPQNLFNEKLSEAFLTLYNKPKSDETLGHDTLEEIQQVNVYSYPNDIKALFEEANLTVQYIHYNTLLYRAVLSLTSSVEFPYQLFIHFQSEAMDVFLIYKNQITFNNRFSVTNEDEFLYYIFFIIEQFNLHSDELELVFLGKMDAFNSYYEVVRKYHNYIKFEEDKNLSTPDFTQHHAPYLASYLS